MPGPAPERSARLHLAPGVCRALLVLHLVAGVGWMGVDIALLVLLHHARTTSDPVAALGGYASVGLIVPAAVPPLGLGVLVTGLGLGWGTPWGLTRHWWVLVKLVLALVMTALVFFLLLPLVGRLPPLTSAEAQPARDGLGRLPVLLMFPPAVSFLLLALAAVLSVFRPWGRTPWAR
ncbi:hypothetical protein [Deinococcus apachensis]|uniref:hypothetical protein n=1 Tax=Deinococcus apachensis TaxID=309886 RepID=UPI0003650B0B|nr:hypothetical protein [Deinococcus apachensis]